MIQNSDSEGIKTALSLLRCPDSRNIETVLRMFQRGEYDVEELFRVFEFNYGGLSRDERIIYYDIFVSLELCAADNFRKGVEHVRRSVDEYLGKSANL